MDTKLIEKCKKYIKKGKTDRLYKYVMKKGLQEEVIKQLFYDSFRKSYEGQEYIEAMKLSDFAIRISQEKFTEKFGEDLTKKFLESIYNLKKIFIRNEKLYELMIVPINCKMSKAEMENMKKIFDMASSKENIIGTHITGTEKRKIIS